MRDIYFAECLKATANNMAQAFGGHIINESLENILHPKETESAEDIIERIKGKVNGRI